MHAHAPVSAEQSIIPSAQGEREAGQRDALLGASTSSARATARAILLEARAARGHTLLLSIVVLSLACRFSFLLSNRFNHGRRAIHTMAANPSFFPAFNPRPPSPTQHALTSTLNDPTSAVLTVRCAAPLFSTQALPLQAIGSRSCFKTLTTPDDLATASLRASPTGR